MATSTIPLFFSLFNPQSAPRAPPPAGRVDPSITRAELHSIHSNRTIHVLVYEYTLDGPIRDIDSTTHVISI